jgi:hypothetical protein
MERVSSIFPHCLVPADRDERNDIMMKIEDEYPEIELFLEEDREFYGSRENLDRLIIEYVMNHREDFIEPNDEIVKKYRRRDRIQEHLGIEPEEPDLEGAEELLNKLSGFAESVESEWKNAEVTRIKEILHTVGKTEAMKAYRAAFSCSLDEAKEAIEKLKRNS